MTSPHKYPASNHNQIDTRQTIIKKIPKDMMLICQIVMLSCQILMSTLQKIIIWHAFKIILYSKPFGFISLCSDYISQ